MNNTTYTNDLIHESSPYLLQHAHNPVDWKAWSDEILERAQEKNQLLLISIGYAACHWCHVMEHECFEDLEVAQVMNANFVNIKVDREERPDVDHIYMDALQMMTGSGGWPLNIVALPDGRPFWGATYVRKEDWKKVLLQLADLYKKDPDKVLGYARNMAEGIQAINLVENNEVDPPITLSDIETSVNNLSRHFDLSMGGYRRAPKFMMPVNLNFLLHYGTVTKKKDILDYVDTTLTKMAWGGIFDHVGGGFSRYSVDTKWHVPHFEKMLYDNGQLVSLYAQAYAATQNGLYRKVVERTVDFIGSELMNSGFGFYSSLDADSINENGTLQEGAFYVWKEDDLRKLLGADFSLFRDYFNINEYGHWEEGNYVLIRNAPTEALCKKYDIEADQLDRSIKGMLEILKGERDQRPRPRLDDKILTSWNGLMLKGLADAYRYLKDTRFLDLALKNATFINENLSKPDGGLYHNHKEGKSTLNGYLEDYASVIEAFIALYEATFDEKWLRRSKELTEYCLAHFYDEESKMFFFTSVADSYVIRRTIETTDNVVPASNSIMAKNLFKLSRYFSISEFEDLALQQLRNVQGQIKQNGQSYANWMQLALYANLPFYEVVIAGEDYRGQAEALLPHYLPHCLFAGGGHDTGLPILQDRSTGNTTQFHLCEKGRCQLPLTRTEEVLTQLLPSDTH
ncbi:hypothetical protein SAMN04488513_106115 [Pseudozobellia thermophila]|uniref:Spermatogenesis-associated protein 20-like TRX domain-containing protein n=1 Tax=Pseudozobellia thermophila TaxID=192903 RepID=A0A1M6KM55_9FLAO|nr:thioredoxin domain-containing protein [Pseudozobellia thermophila]SHJ59985.1 hypothetical protein SAMN04488513_106115 [Pseudozobellia thermophila]